MRRIMILLVCAVIVVLLVLMVGCEDANGKINYGFEFKSTHEDISGIFVAYSMQSQVCEDEEISIELYFGHILESVPQNVESNFDLVIYSSKQKDNMIKKEIPGFYDNEEYICSLSKNNKYSRTWEIDYPHKEIIILPKELFCEEEDEIVLKVQGKYGLNDIRSGWISFSYSKTKDGNIKIRKGTDNNVSYT